MPNTQELLLKYSKMFILGALVILIVEFIISGNPLEGERFYEYLFANILPLFFLCLNFCFYEYSVIKKYKENINMAICCM